MSVRTLPRILGDTIVVGLGVLALADGVREAGLLHPVAGLFTAGWVIALLARRRWPWSPALVPLLVATHGMALQAWPNESAVSMLALFLSAWLFGLHTPLSRGIAAAPLWPAAISALIIVTPYGEAGLSDLLYPGAFSLVALGGGIVVGRATRRQREARHRADAAERELEEGRAAIVSEERARIAQDLRALVADEIRGIQQHAMRTRAMLDHGDLTTARRALLEIEEAGRATLADLRHMLGLLRRDMTEDALAPQPGLAALDGIVRRAAQRGVVVELVVEGQRGPVPRGVEVVAYRAMERTVDHACRHGVASMVVRIHQDARAIAVQVTARGLGRLVEADHLAIQERVLLYGGDLLVATDEYDRDVLQIRLPLRPAAAAEGVPS